MKKMTRTKIEYKAGMARYGAEAVDYMLGKVVTEEGVIELYAELPASALKSETVSATGLAARLNLATAGDRVTVAFRLWNRRVGEVEIVDIVHTQFGKALSMELAALNRLARDGDGVTHAALHADLAQREALWQAVKSAPFISAVVDKDAVVRAFNARTERNMGVFSGILTAFAVAMAVGIIYNAARIALRGDGKHFVSLDEVI